MRNSFGWLGRGTTPWGFLNQLISHLPLDTILTEYQHSTYRHCGIPWFTYFHCESTLSLYATYCHYNIHLTFSNTNVHSSISTLQLSIKTITRTDTNTHQHILHISFMYIYIYTSTSYAKTCWIRSLLLALFFLNWRAWWLIILTNTFLTPKGSAPCLNIWCRNSLDVLINCVTEEVVRQIWSTSALNVAKNIFDGIVLLLYGNLTTLKL